MTTDYDLDPIPNTYFPEDYVAPDADVPRAGHTGDPDMAVPDAVYSDSANTIKQLPHSLIAEQSVIGGLMLSPEAWDMVCDSLLPEHFYLKKHQVIFSAVADIANSESPVDVVTVSDYLTSSNSIELVGGLEYLVNLVRNTPSVSNIRQYGKVVLDYFTRRSLISASGKLMDQAYNLNGITTDELLTDAERTVMSIAERRPNVESYTTLRPLIKEAIDKLDYLNEHGDQLTGITSGFDDLDDKTCGFQKSDLIIVAARPSMGKTTIALNMVENAMLATKKPVLVFSLEMPKDQLVNRMISSLGRINQTRLRNGQMQDDDWVRLTPAISTMKDLPLMINDTPGLSPNEMRSIARRARSEHGEIGMIMVDYLQLMQLKGDRRTGNRTEEISEISRSLKALAKEMNCPVIALSQLNRSLEQRPNKRPVNSDLRESGAIEQDADLILFIYRDEVYNEDSADKGIAEVIIGKQRNGPLGTVRLAFLGQYSRFENLTTEYYQGYGE